MVFSFTKQQDFDKPNVSDNQQFWEEKVQPMGFFPSFVLKLRQQK